MKKVLIAIAATGFATAACAQSNVTVYGSLDDGISYTNNVGGSALESMNQGTMQPDVIGFRGVEDLGDGMKAGFKLEAGFASNTGALTSAATLFKRESSVSISGDFGSIKMGNMPDFAFDYVGPLSNAYLLTNWYLFNPGNLDNLANTFEYNNAVRYTTVDMSGLTLGAMYGFGGVAGNNQQNRDVSIGGNYANGPLHFAFSYSNENNRAAGFAGTFLGTMGLGNAGTVFNKLTTYAVGASYQLGDVRLNGTYTSNDVELPTVDVMQKNTGVGASWHYSAANALNVGYTHSSFDGGSYNQYSLGNVYSFSKRTQAYVQAAYQRVGDSAKFAYMNGDTGASNSSSQWETSVGIHHSF